MHRLVTLIGVAVVVGAAAVFSHAEEEARESEIATFESVQQDEDYRVSLLGVTKGIAFLDSQELINDGGRRSGKHAVPWMRVVTVIENLTERDEPWSLKVETADATEFVGKINIEWNDGHVVGSRTSGLAEMDLHYPPLRDAIFPVETPQGSSPQTKVYLLTLSGKIQSHTVTLRFSFGGKGDRRELIFKNVPMP